MNCPYCDYVTPVKSKRRLRNHIRDKHENVSEKERTKKLIEDKWEKDNYE